MAEEEMNSSRRKFLLGSSAAVAATPFLLSLTGVVPAASAETPSPAQAGGPSQGEPGGNRAIYYITNQCIGCQTCRTLCPQKAIDFGDRQNEINQSKCIHCGVCFRNCPNGVITATES